MSLIEKQQSIANIAVVPSVVNLAMLLYVMQGSVVPSIGNAAVV